MRERFVAVAVITRPQGLGGEVRLEVFNPDSDLLFRRPAIRLVTAAGEVLAPMLRSLKRAGKSVVARLDGVDDREAAEALRGATVEVRRADLAPTAEDEYYHCDLEGCQVEVGGEVVGRVTRVIAYPTCDCLVIEGDGRKAEVPLSGDTVSSIDVASGRVVLHRRPDGLD